MFRDGFGGLLAERGYRAVVQQVRGFSGSTEDFIPFAQERNDGLETVQWLKKEGICPDVIHTWGGSYFGLTQWAIADSVQGAKVFQISSPRLSEAFFPGGAFAQAMALYWTARNENIIATPKDILAATLDRATGESDNALLGHNSKTFDAWLSRGPDVEQWNLAFPHAEANAVLGPVLLMAGWFDPFLPAQLKDFNELAKRSDQTRLLIGPWSHAETQAMPDGTAQENYRISSIRHALDWYDCYEHRETCAPAAVSFFLMGENRWYESSQFPPANTVEESFGLQAIDGVLAVDLSDPVPTLGGVDLGLNAGPSNQRLLDSRSDILRQDITLSPVSTDIVGYPKIEVLVASASPCFDVAVILADHTADGNSYIFSEGVRRMTRNAGDLTSAQRVVVDLWPTAYRLQKGHSLRVYVMGNRVPRYDSACLGTEMPKTGRSLHFRGESSVLRLPILHKK